MTRRDVRWLSDDGGEVIGEIWRELARWRAKRNGVTCGRTCLTADDAEAWVRGAA